MHQCQLNDAAHPRASIEIASHDEAFMSKYRRWAYKRTQDKHHSYTMVRTGYQHDGEVDRGPGDAGIGVSWSEDHVYHLLIYIEAQP